jgi:hypothetical protein
MAAQGVPTGLCKVCGHPARVQIELMVAGGAHQRPIGRKFGLTHHAIGRHWRRHVTPERRSALLLGPTQRMSLACQVSEESASVLDHYKAVRAGLFRLFESSLEANDQVGGSLAAGRLLSCLNSMAKLTGQLSVSLVSHTTNNIFMDPRVAAVEAIIVRALADHPAARAAVIRALRAAEASEEEPATPLPAIEHEGAHADGAA